MRHQIDAANSNVCNEDEEEENLLTCTDACPNVFFAFTDTSSRRQSRELKKVGSAMLTLADKSSQDTGDNALTEGAGT